MGSCIICESKAVIRYSGYVAPFLANRVWNRKPFAASLLRCCDCGFQFFEPRLTKEEERVLYNSYRSASYQRERQFYEKSYTPEFNDELTSTRTMIDRTAKVRSILESHIGGNISSVLDFGGGRGELIEHLIPSADRFVYDIGNSEPIKGIRSVSLDCELKADLIICSNVLEHVRSPREILKEIARFTHEKSLVYVEVPADEPLSWRTRILTFAQVPRLLLTKPPLGWSIARFGPAPVMHEHLNFFSDDALVELGANCGFTKSGSGRYDQTLWILFRVSGTNASE